MAKRNSLGRALAPALLLQLGLAPLAVHALGLGSLRVDSALGQPLSASIELVGATLAEAELATISLASAEVYERMGVEGIATLRFAVHAGKDGRPYVRVTSPEPIREPYVDFVVEAISPTGQVIRHYTALLDPVGSSPVERPPVAAWSGGVTPAPVQPWRSPRPRRDPFSGIALPKAGAEFGPVPPGATLWAIARRVQPAGTGLDAVMSAIVRANPNAFINGDLNRLKAGSRLAIPVPEALRNPPSVVEPPPPAETAEPVVNPAAPAAAPAEAPAEATGNIETPPAVATPSAEVRVLRSEDAAAPVASPGSEEQTPTDAGSNRVQLLEETLDATQQQNEALQQRLSFLEEQIKTLTALVKDMPADAKVAAEQAPAATAATPTQADPQTPSLASVQTPAIASNTPPSAQVDTPQFASGYLAAAGLGAAVLGGWWLWMRRRRSIVEPTFIAATDNPGASGFEGPTEDFRAPPSGGTLGSPNVPGTSIDWVQEVPAPVMHSDRSLATDDDPDDDALGDPVDSQIDLLAAYVGMADGDSARQIYAEIERVGTATQRAQAAELIARLDS